VLVVEDNLLIAMDLETLLREFGCDVIGPIGDPAGVVAALRTEKPQAAVLDIIHRGHHTFELADALALAQVPFVFLSGHNPSGNAWRNRPKGRLRLGGKGTRPPGPCGVSFEAI
jgi:CheY-like chemotaxis protein